LELYQIKAIFVLNRQAMTSKDGKLWNNLSKDEIEELLLANEESENPDNLISHDDVKKKYAEWL
jgi:hypothetical protein